uniref:otospiralin-like n=1 Tax=Scatophagus argus TaxID=75038 RepID=UPI001ED854F1|nr:otospiralin-like [Scatophagus argus]
MKRRSTQMKETANSPFKSSAGTRQKRGVPNWAMTSSDFFGWVEELRKHAGYDRIDDLARTFWAHFPSADRLGYGADEPDE